jgi:pimeloyl-ACP methyl ester carboxylesterase
MNYRSRFTTSGLILAMTLWLLSPANFAQKARDLKVDLGGHGLHVLDVGTGDPAVVFVSGMGEDLSTWKDVQPAIAKLTRTLSYDRAGLGKSDAPASTHARDARELATELRALLHAAQVPAPYVLVGHSLGGAIVQVFAHEYSGDVAGLVLVDPGDGRLDKLLRSKLPPDIWSARQKELAEEMPKLPEGVRREYEGLDASGEEADQAFPLPSVSIVLLTGTKKNRQFPGNPLEQDLKLELHNQLAARSPGMEHVLVPASRHYIQNDAPDKVIAAIKRVLRNARTAAPKTRKESSLGIILPNAKAVSRDAFQLSVDRGKKCAWLHRNSKSTAL